MKVKITGLNNEEKEFEILERRELEEILDEIELDEIWRKTRKLAESYPFSGTAVTYLDGRNGEIDTYWISQGSYLHPFDSFYRIPLCTMETPIREFTEDDLLDNDERHSFWEWQEENEGDVEDYIIVKWGVEALQEREQNALEIYAETFEPDWQQIFSQIDELYQQQG